jgi:TP901 family phage tail tape measure protein
MGYSLGTASGVISTTYNGKGVDQAQKDIDGLTKRTGSTRGALGDIGKVAGVAGLAIAAGFGLAVNSAANFEQRMSAVKAVSGASASEMDQLTKKALQLGKDTSFSAGEAALAIEELVKAGVSVPDVMNGAADATVALAAAGEIDLPKAAAIASNAMNQFNLTAQQMPHVADLIAGAANASAIDVSEFGQSLTQVGAVANLIGASFDDTAAAIALMGNAGIKGSDAGTSLKTMLMNLQPQTNKQKALFKDLGIITADGANQFFDATGKLKSFADIAGILQGKLAGMSDAQKTATLQTLFGTDAIRAAAIFTNQGAKGFNDMAGAMGKMKAADVAKTRMDNFKGSLEQMKGSLETAGIVVGTVLLPALRGIVDAVTSVLNGFLSLSTGTQQTILTIVGIVGAALLMTAAVLKIILVISKVVEILKILRAAMAITWIAALGPIALIIIAIAAIVAIFIVLWKRSATFRGFFIGIWNAIKAVVSGVLGWFTGTLWPGIQAVWNGISTGLAAVAAVFVAIWNAIKAVVMAVVNAISAFIRGAVNVWNVVISAVLNAISAAITAITGVWKSIISAVMAGIMAIWRPFWNVFGGVITAAFQLIVAIIKLYVAIWRLLIETALLAIRTVVNAVWNAISSITKTVLNAIRAAISAAWNAIRSVTTTVWNAIRSFFVTIWNAIRSAVTVAVNAVRSVLVAAWNIIRNITSSVWNAIRSVIISAINAVRGPVTSVVNAIRSIISSVWNAIRSVTSSVWNSLSGVVGGALNNVLGRVRGIVSTIRGVFSGAASWLFNAGKDIIRGLLNGIESLISSVTSKLKSLTNLIPKLKGPPEKDKKLLQNNGRLIMQGLGIGVDEGIVKFIKLLEGIAPLIPDTLSRTTNVQQLVPPGLVPTSGRVIAAPVAAPAGTGATIHLTTINPVGKTTTEELSEQATRLSMLGVL